MILFIDGNSQEDHKTSIIPRVHSNNVHVTLGQQVGQAQQLLTDHGSLLPRTLVDDFKVLPEDAASDLIGRLAFVFSAAPHLDGALEQRHDMLAADGEDLGPGADVLDVHAVAQRQDLLGHLVERIAGGVAQLLRVADAEQLAIDLEGDGASGTVLDLEAVAGEGEELLLDLEFGHLVVGVVGHGVKGVGWVMVIGWWSW